MALVLDDPQLEQLAQRVAEKKQLNIKDAVNQALLHYLIEPDSDKKILGFPINTSEIAMVFESDKTSVLAKQLPVVKKFATPEQERMFEEAMAIARHCASLSVLDNRTDEEILGYNEQGYFD